MRHECIKCALRLSTGALTTREYTPRVGWGWACGASASSTSLVATSLSITKTVPCGSFSTERFTIFLVCGTNFKQKDTLFIRIPIRKSLFMHTNRTVLSLSADYAECSHLQSMTLRIKGYSWGATDWERSHYIMRPTKGNSTSVLR